MSALLREWLMGVTAAALAVALAQALTPEGTVKRVGRLVGGLVLLLAVLKPALSLELPAPEELADLPGSSAAPTAEGAREEVLKTLIARKTGAYILDKGQSMGCELTGAEVTVADDPSGWPVPWSVRLTGTWTEETRQALEGELARELAIPGERQTWQEEGS